MLLTDNQHPRTLPFKLPLLLPRLPPILPPRLAPMLYTPHPLMPNGLLMPLQPLQQRANRKYFPLAFLFLSKTQRSLAPPDLRLKLDKARDSLDFTECIDGAKPRCFMRCRRIDFKFRQSDFAVFEVFGDLVLALERSQFPSEREVVFPETVFLEEEI